MRREDLYLYDIVEAADAIARFITQTSRDEFVDDDLTSSAVLQKLSIIGEAAARLSEAFKSSKPDVPWREIVAFRNIAVHAYFALDWEMVWRTATEDAPALRGTIAEILKQEFPQTFLRLPSP